jgi:dihydrofolate synthase/folylpolyglutamate synthase
MPLTYEQAVAQLLSLADFERKSRLSDPPTFHLKRTLLLLEALGNPHLKVPAIHVAGTKGKGSTCAMVASALTACGYRTGMFISPHLHRITERISVNTEPVSPEKFADLDERIWPIATEIGERGDSGIVSVFEFQTVMAFLHFAEIEAEAAVIEVGLGGRLDSTNVVQPEVSVITPIGLDHVAILGNTIAAIAGEKAGIIKPGVPVATSLQPAEAMEVIARKARENNAPLTKAESIAILLDSPCGHGPQHIRLRGELGEYDIRLPLLGRHQVNNARTAVAALERFAAAGHELDTHLIAAGISSVSWPARVQLLDAGPPLLIADGAHNADSAIALRAAVERHFGRAESPVLILGATGGHDNLAVARAFEDLSPRVVVTTSRHPKAIAPQEFASALEEARICVSGVSESTREALELARRLAGPSGAIIATGSLFVAAEVIEEVMGMEPEVYPDMRGPAGPVRAHLTPAAPAP